MKRIAILIATVGVLLLPSAALASSTCQQYSSQDCNVSTVVSTTSTAATTSASTLPFTGLDVVLLAAGGASLLGAGLVVRRLSRG
jgi:hypothetical protein